MRRPLLSTVGINELFVTVTLLPYMYGEDARTQLKKTFQSIKDLLQIYSDKFLIVAELTKDGNIHYHASVKPRSNDMDYPDAIILDALKKHNKGKVKIFGRSQVDSDNKYQVKTRFEYLTKDLNKTYKIVNLDHPKNPKDVWDYYVRPVGDHIPLMQTVEPEVKEIFKKVAEVVEECDDIFVRPGVKCLSLCDVDPLDSDNEYNI